jgi:hypothetical protein
LIYVFYIDYYQPELSVLGEDFGHGVLGSSGYQAGPKSTVHARRIRHWRTCSMEPSFCESNNIGVDSDDGMIHGGGLNGAEPTATAGSTTPT